jgi:hypothetical protein
VDGLESEPAASAGFITPPRFGMEETPPSVEDMTKALLQGLKISPNPDSVTGKPKIRDNQEKATSVLDQFIKVSGKSNADSTSSKIASQARDVVNKSAEDISKSLLNLLQSSAS